MQGNPNYTISLPTINRPEDERKRVDKVWNMVTLKLETLRPGDFHLDWHQDALNQLAHPGYAKQRAIHETKAMADRLSEQAKSLQAALDEASKAHEDALQAAGLNPSIFVLLRSWIDMRVGTQEVIQQMRGKLPLNEPSPSSVGIQYPDPIEPLTAAELGQRMGGLSDDTVRLRERKGELFSIMRPARKRGREYPAFQAWPGIEGEPLSRCLRALGAADGGIAYGFFTSPTDLLGGLTPIEVLAGRKTSERVLDEAAKDLLVSPPVVRLDLVERFAHTYSAGADA